MSRIVPSIHHHWPLVRKQRHEEEIGRLKQTIRERDQQLSRIGHRVVEVKREHAKMLSDLRLARVQIDYPSPTSDKIGFAFQMHGAIFDGYRHDRTFVELLSYMVEEQMHRSPEGRETLAGLYTGGLR